MCDKAKALKIKIGTPHFEIKEKLAQHGVTVFSSNYTLYGDLSKRVMNILERMAPAIEVYSIDEAFMDMRGMSHFDLHAYALEIRSTVLCNTGIPTCVGIAHTKALAKAANRVAKKFKERTEGVWVLDTPEKVAKCLHWLPVADVWGIGYRHAAKLEAMGVKTAQDFVELPAQKVREMMSVVGERLQMELKGVSCLPLDLVVHSKQSICTSRSFGKMLDQLDAVESAVGFYASRCARKLRAQRLCARTITVFLQTNSFKPELPQRSVSSSRMFPVETSDTLEITSQALQMLRALWKDGYRYKKAGVIMMDTVPEAQIQGDVFDTIDRGKARKSMIAMDLVNKKYGADLVKLGIVDQGQEWKLRREILSPCYTTNWEQLLVVSG
jgi:DNA polymerase V